MRTITINDFQTNFNLINNSLQKNEYLLLTNKDNAIGLLSSFTDDLFQQGFLQWLGIKAFKNGDLTLRQLAGMLKKDIDTTIKILNSLNIPVIDYDFTEDIDTIKSL